MILKKSSFLCAAVLLFVLTVASVCFAAQKPAATVPVEGVGVIDIDEVVNKHPGMANARQQAANLSRQKENEAKAAADKESDPAKKAQIVQAKRMELAKEEQKIMDPIFRDCQQAVREVAVNKKLTLVLNKSVVLIGGSDITQDVIQQLAKTKK
mgnify:CR=1 FL=1